LRAVGESGDGGTGDRRGDDTASEGDLRDNEGLVDVEAVEMLRESLGFAALEASILTVLCVDVLRYVVDVLEDDDDCVGCCCWWTLVRCVDWAQIVASIKIVLKKRRRQVYQTSCLQNIRDLVG
jgi:hypothetical protein